MSKILQNTCLMQKNLAKLRKQDAAASQVSTTMSFAFERPIGAPGDVTELDYIAALHQTDVPGGIRKDGSIQDEDISLFLSSRYGVSLTPEEINKRILTDLGSTDGFMDMMQLVSLLLIPVLREEQEERLKGENDSVHNLTNSQKDDLLTYAVEMMLHDVTGSRQPKVLTSTLIRQIFQAYGEEVLAENEDLVRAMLEQAGGGHHRRVLLDAKTFCKALTADVQEFDINNKNKLSTNFDDVMGDPNERLNKKLEETADTEPHDNGQTSNENGDVESTPNGSSKSLEGGEKEGEKDDIPLIPTAPQIDNVADTFRSKPLVLCQWTFFVLTFQTYLIQFLNLRLLQEQCPDYERGNTWVENAGAFFCTIAMSVVKWIIVMILMSIGGIFYFYIGGMGNKIETINPKYPAIGAFIMLLWTWLPPLLPVYRDLRAEKSPPREYLIYCTAILGSSAVVVTLWHLIGMVIPKASRWREWLKCILVPEAVRTESRIKEAADYKINNMVKNALEVHRVKKQETVVPTHFGQALLNYAETAPEFEKVGGYLWTLKSMWNLSLFRKEGVLFTGRLVSTNFIQFLITIFILIFGVVLTARVGRKFDDIWAAVDTVFETFLVIDVPATREIIESLEGQVSNYIPTPEEKKLVIYPLSIGVAVAFVSSCFITAMVLPSASSTTLMFRSGVLPFVHDPRVTLLRNAPDQTAFLRGFMYWGCLFASVLLGSIWAGIVFLYLWHVTAPILQGITASIIGALVVIGVHVLINRNVRNVAASAYYRKKPKVANLAVLFRECGLVALTQSFVWLRVLRLGIIAVFYVGRLDSPLLYDSLGQVGGFRVDREPYMFHIEILQHEAHRHPYIETLGVMYLLKLKHQDTFGNMAGSCWRLIFVYILMPWLSKYRAVRRPLPEYEGEGDEEAGAPPRPLRAVTLVDPQAYALRAVSLVPVASGWGGASTVRRMSVMSGGSGGGSGSGGDSLLRDNLEEENRDLREENENLRKQLQQLRLANLGTATTLPSRDDRPENLTSATVPNRGRLSNLTTATLLPTRDLKPSRRRPEPEDTTAPVRPPEFTPREVKRTNTPGVEVDSRGRPIPTSPGHPARKVTESGNRMVRIEEDLDEPPQRHMPSERGESQGLSILRPPTYKPARNEGAQVSWTD